MTKELKLLRYGLIAVPAFLSMYVQEYSNNGQFTLHLLILLLLATLGARLPARFTAAMAAAEMLYASWLCFRYGSLMALPSLSALLVYSRLRPRPLPFLLAGIHLAALNAAVMEASPLIRAWVNLVFLLAAALSFQLHSAGRGKEETLHLYDELRKKHFELDEARSRILQFASQVENAAQAEERVRISRQLHDDIGHRMIRVKMMMEAALHTLPSAPEAGMTMMGQVRDQLAECMDDLRFAVRRISRGPQLEGAYALDRLLEETGRDTGIGPPIRWKARLIRSIRAFRLCCTKMPARRSPTDSGTDMRHRSASSSATACPKSRWKSAITERRLWKMMEAKWRRVMAITGTMELVRNGCPAVIVNYTLPAQLAAWAAWD